MKEASYKKKTTVKFHLHEVVGAVKIMKTEGVTLVARGWGKAE